MPPIVPPAILSLHDAIAASRQCNRFEAMPYFCALENGAFTKADFAETQIQFLSAVVFFSRPMTVLAARMPRPELRVDLLRNIADEHGGGDLRLSHEATFLQFLARLGVSSTTLAARSFGPEVRAFNLALWGVCSWDDPSIAAACLGMIEDLFARISAYIGERVIANGWIKSAELVHYKTHATLDLEHAADFFRLLEAPYGESLQQAQQIQDGLALGSHLLLQLYQGLYEARCRRSMRMVAGPSSLADGWIFAAEAR